VTQNAQSSSTQTRTYVYDGLSRLTSEANPETYPTAVTYTYDTDSTCGTSHGDLVKKIDAVGNVICSAYDALHRNTSITYPSGSYASVTPSKTFVYDSATVNSVAMANAKGRLAEAYTGSSKTTDLGFSYSVRGEVANVYQSSPHSGGYYNVAATYWANGLLDTLNPNLSGIPTWTYGPDGEGRVSTVSASTGTNPVSGTSYNGFSQPTSVTYGSSDSDDFVYDGNTGRMTQYQATISGSSVTGTPGWNSNWTLGSLTIVDPFNSANAQTCNYTHDDLARLGNVNCGGSGKWNQAFSYDAFGNISKTGSGTGFSFQPTYTSSTNRYATLPNGTPAYDANGNLTNDSFHTYAWDSDANLTTLGSSTTLTSDALDRRVEQTTSGASTEILYGPDGSKLALMNGTTVVKVFAPLPGGATAVYTSSGLAYYRHSDWLGSSRLASTPSRTVYYDGAYAPFGEPYAETGTTDRNFTGQNQDLTSDLYDFLYREYHPTQGRWIQPDPAGLSVIDATDPQTWNRYGYVASRPLEYFDLGGLLLSAFDTEPLPDPQDGGGSTGEFWIDFGDNLTHPPTTGPVTRIAFNPPGTGAQTPAPPNPCAGASANNLVYTPAVKSHILDVHLTFWRGLKTNMTKSQYIFEGAIKTTPQAWAMILQFNAYSFTNPATIVIGKSAIAFTAPYPIHPPAAYVGFEQTQLPNIFGGLLPLPPPISSNPTTLNTFVVQNNCTSVVTSYPGNPTSLQF